MKMMLISEKNFDDNANRAEKMFNLIYKTLLEEELKANGVPQAFRDPLLATISAAVHSYNDFLKKELIGGNENGE